MTSRPGDGARPGWGMRAPCGAAEKKNWQALAVRLVAYTDAVGVGGAEISLANLLTVLRDDPGLELTVLGSSAEVVERVTPAGVPRILAPTLQHPAVLARLRPDVVHANLPVPWSASLGLAASLALPGARVLAVQQLPLRTIELPTWLRTRSLL